MIQCPDLKVDKSAVGGAIELGRPHYRWGVLTSLILLARNSCSTLVSGLAYGAAQWLMVVSFARHTTSSDLGMYALSAAVASPVFLLFEMRMRIVAACTREHTQHQVLLVYRMVAVIAAGVVSAALTSAYRPTLFAVATAVVLYKAIESISDVSFGIMQANNMLHTACALQAGRALLQFVTVRSAIAWTSSIPLTCTAVAVVWSVYFALVEYRLLSRPWRPQGGFWTVLIRGVEVLRGNISRTTKDNVPLGIAGPLCSLNSTAPRFILEHRDGLATVGHYSSIYFLSYPILRSGSAMVDAGVPLLVKAFRRGRSDLLYVSGMMACMIGVVGIMATSLCWFAGTAILRTVLSSEYQTYNRTFALQVGANTMDALVGLVLAVCVIVAEKKAIGVLPAAWIAFTMLMLLVVRFNGVVGSVVAAALLANACTLTLSLLWVWRATDCKALE